jgi:hypothetical protein
MVGIDKLWKWREKICVTFANTYNCAFPSFREACLPCGWLYSSPTSVTRSRFGCQLRWVHFSGPPRFGPMMIFFGFFLLNLGSTAPNYSRRPLMRSSKAPPNQKNRGQLLPEPTRTHRSWHLNLLRVTLVGEK